MNRPPNFDRIARPYRWLEYLTLGPLLERTRFTHLRLLAEHLPAEAQSLVLGDGDGRFTAALLEQMPSLSAHAVDLSPAMLALLRHRVDQLGPNVSARLRTTLADVRQYATPIPAPDLIATHFLLDCLSQQEVESLVNRLSTTLPPGGLWLVSEFRVPAGPLHLPAWLLIRLLYMAFRLLTGLRVTALPDYADAFRRAGLVPVAVRHQMLGILTAELWQRP